MNYKIRPVGPEDAKDLNALRIMDGCRENTLALFSERVSRSEDFLQSLSEYEHILVAETGESGTPTVVAIVGLHINKNPRLRHSASVGIMVHTAHQGKGVGTALLKKVIDLADNWLMLVRLDLTVFTENQGAVKLYQKFGFEIEGTKKFAAIRHGKYADEYLMARYRIGT